MSTALSEQVMTFDECQDYMRRSGFRFHRTDYPVISPETALLALTALDEKIAASGVYGDTLTDCIAARDELQTAICAATEAA